MTNEVIETWFRLRDAMFANPQTAVGARPPSLREACYAVTLAQRNKETATTPETIEAFVNGLELGAMMALRTAWDPDH